MPLGCHHRVDSASPRSILLLVLFSVPEWLLP
jgi:hypothetical protein